MIHLDTSVVVDALGGPQRAAPRLRQLLSDGERVLLSSPVLYEWLRGPRNDFELEAQEALFPRATAVAFGPEEAALAAEIYRSISRPRGREIDLAIAACAILGGATLWTLNPGDFRDIPRLSLVPIPAVRRG